MRIKHLGLTTDSRVGFYTCNFICKRALDDIFVDSVDFPASF